jgi:exodeoxyribonuclease VII small subunit
MAKEKLTYSKSMAELESIMQELQDGSISIDDLHIKVKRAKELLAWCHEKLRSTQKDIEID